MKQTKIIQTFYKMLTMILFKKLGIFWKFRFQKQEYNYDFIQKKKPHVPRNLLLDRLKSPNDALN